MNSFKLKNIIWSLSAVAAVLLLFFSLNYNNNPSDQLEDLADVSSEMAETQGYFTLAINKELEKIEGKRSPETQKLIDDAMRQLQTLESDYVLLRQDLNKSGDDQRIIFAMISNFQNRVDLLEDVLTHINQINELNTNTDEENNTI